MGSWITPSTVLSIAHSLDVPQLSEEAAKALAPDVEYRLREVIQEALKFAKHSKRVKLTIEDINNALRIRNVEPLYGFGSRDPSRFVRASGHPDLFYFHDPERPFSQVIEAPLPKVPRDVGLTAHWLAINGQQPVVPENAPLEQPPAKRPRLDQSALFKQGAPHHQQQAQQQQAQQAQQQQQQQPDHAKHGDVVKGAQGAARGGAAAGVAPLAGGAAGGGDVAVQPPVRHLLSRELQVYFDRLVGLLQAAAAAEAAACPAPEQAGPGAQDGAAARVPAAAPAAAAPPSGDRQEALFRAALASVSSDPGLHPLAPYFTAYIADGVAQNLGCVPLLRRLLALAHALLSNPNIKMDLYLQQLLPAVLTCMLTKTLGPRGGEEHWALREQAATLAALAARLFGAPYHNVAPRLVRLMAKAFLDPSKGFACKYGAVVGLQALGPRVVRTALVPHLEPFVSADLVPAMGGAEAQLRGAPGEDARGAGGGLEAGAAAAERELRRREAQRLFGALADATGSAMYDRLIGLLADRLPEHVVMRRGPQPAAGQGWDELDKQAALAAKVRVLVRQRPLRVRLRVAPVAAAAAAGGNAGGGWRVVLEVEEVTTEEVAEALERHERERPAAPGGSGESGALAALLRKHAPPPGERGRRQQQQRQAQGRTAGGPGEGRGSAGRPVSAVEVLRDAWMDDSDVNAQLGALVHVFGEAVVARMPLGELPCFNL